MRTEDMYYNEQKRSEVMEAARRLRRKFLRYQQAQQEIRRSVEKLKSASADGMQSDAMQELFKKLNRKLRIYGKAAYSQGFHDAVHVFRYQNQKGSMFIMNSEPCLQESIQNTLSSE